MLQPEIRLRQAIIDGNLLVVKRLLKRFPDLLENIDSSNGWSSLHYAAFNGRYLVCVHLVSLGHDKPEVLRTFKKNTTVHLALLNGHEQTTHLLLQHFPSLLNSKGEHGHTPLHVSSFKDHFKCVEMLLGLGADINAIDEEGNNALHLAMKYGSLTTIKILIQRNIDTSLKNAAALKPIDVASSFKTEKFYNDILNNKSPNEEDEFIPTQNKLLDDISFSHKRSHSNSLPILPSVTTGRRTSNASSTTRSPIPRTAISSTFNGSNSSSYVYSPVASHFNSNLSIKPPTIQTEIPSVGSPVLYSPVNPSNLNDKTSLTASFPSMTSLSSVKNASMEPSPSSSSNRSRAQSTQFVSINKTRSNSGSKQLQPKHSSSSSSLQSISKQNSQTVGTPAGKISPSRLSPPSSSLNLSRSSTGTTKSDPSENRERSRTNSINSQQPQLLPIRSRENSVNSNNFHSSSINSMSSNINRSRENSMGSKSLSTLEKFENEELQLKLNEKFDEYKKRSNGGGYKSILNIPIASLSRRKEEEI